MSPDTPRAPEHTSALLLHRPPRLTTGAARRVRVYLDGHHIADLAPGDTIHAPAHPGPHLLRVRCLPLIGASALFILEPDEVLHTRIHIANPGYLEIDLADRQASEGR